MVFAQAQFMSDANGLEAGHWQWSGWLTPKGRVIALFALLKFDQENLWLLLPDAEAGGFVARLQRYVFRSKVAIGVRDDLHVSGNFAAPVHAACARFSGSSDASIEMDMGGQGGPRTLRIGRERVAVDDDAALARWSAFDLQHGLPRLVPSQSEQWTPQQLSLDRLHAYSVKKGCYPGQEIVARTHFLGQAKRGLALLEADAAVAIGADVHDGDRTIGNIVSVAIDGKRLHALAVLPLEHSGDTCRSDGVELRVASLLGGLAR